MIRKSTVVEMTELKKTREDGQCNMEIPLVEMELKDHNIVGMSVVPENTDYACMLANDTTLDVTWYYKAHSNVQFTLVELSNVEGYEGGTMKEMPMWEDTSSNLESVIEVPTKEVELQNIDTEV